MTLLEYDVLLAEAADRFDAGEERFSHAATHQIARGLPALDLLLLDVAADGTVGRLCPDSRGAKLTEHLRADGYPKTGLWEQRLRSLALPDLEAPESGAGAAGASGASRSGRRRLGCRRRRRGAPVPEVVPGQRERKWLRKAQALLTLLLVHVALRCQLLQHPKGTLARLLVYPVHALYTAEYTLIVLAPAICWVTMLIWSRLDLPGQDGVAGQRISTVLRTSLWASLALVAAFALLDGEFSVRVATLVYLFATAVWLACRSEQCKGLRRLARTWAVFWPLICEYKLMYYWLQFANHSGLDVQGAYAPLHEKYAPRVLRLLVEQGGVFVKIGQMLSLLPSGVLPEPFLREFKSLQCRVPPRCGREVRRLVSEALGQPLEAVFSRFDEVPIGSASIGQVHRAKLAASGLEVVVKVQYPEVSQTIEADFTNCERIVWLLDKSKIDEVREAKKHYIDELDFNKEASNLLRVRVGLCKEFPDVRVPEPILEFCSPRVLVMTYLSGHSLLDAIMDMAEAIAKMRGKSVEDLIADFTSKDSENSELIRQDSGRIDLPKEKRRWRLLVANMMPSLLPSIPDTAKLKLLQLCMSTSRSARNFGVGLYNSSAGRLGASKLAYSRTLPSFDPKELSKKLWLIHGHQVLIDGLFSTDPHPGNILVGKGRDAVGLIDFGQVCELKLQTRVLFARLLLALASDDDRQIVEWYKQLGMRSRNGSELLALNARVKFGHSSILSKETYERYRSLSAEDALSSTGDYCLGRVERLVQILRGTSFLLGVPSAHGPTTLWLDIARKLIGGSSSASDSSTEGSEGGVELQEADALPA
ncbi:unnamed protein product [Effrenium voratum]|uniref:ABC1 atypical kinase-like domain-containing protein n=1 Tax=Effrenium voratum TaxID=2562239 RepID=A0AA36IZH5_9DINO|nr:unnamed protein product [Effrenium voratum]